MATVLFDSEIISNVISLPSNSFSVASLFDGYLTENGLGNSKTPSNAIFSSNSLFDGYLTKKVKMMKIPILSTKSIIHFFDFV